MIHYIFDVDGTLTPSRAKMDEKFSSFFFDFCTLNNVYLVTGSDKEKTIEQVGNVIYGMCKRVYNCSGNDVWERGKNVHKGTIKLPDTMWGYLNKEICESEFPVRTGGHIEERTGLVNLSIVGRNAGKRARTQYVAWDNHTNERKNIAKRLSEKFTEFDFNVAGETGIDITIKGNDKSQILTDFTKSDIIHFYGDKCDFGGNDHTIAMGVYDLGEPNSVYQVQDWRETWEQLKSV